MLGLCVDENLCSERPSFEPSRPDETWTFLFHVTRPDVSLGGERTGFPALRCFSLTIPHRGERDIRHPHHQTVLNSSTNRFPPTTDSLVTNDTDQAHKTMKAWRIFELASLNMSFRWARPGQTPKHREDIQSVVRGPRECIVDCMEPTPETTSRVQRSPSPTC